MTYTFSNKIANLNPSAIREILKYTADPSVIPFAAGNPAPEAFPVAAFQRIAAEILRDRPTAALQYSVTEGYPALRTRMKGYMAEKHSSFREGADELIVTAGAQQVMGLAARVLCNEGDAVVCEAPSFIGSLNSFRSLGARLIGVPVESDGMDIAALEQALQANPDARFIYTIPNFQNPSGLTMSAEKRRAVYELARKYRVMILEDNPYGDLRYRGEHIPTIKSLDTDGLVIYAGSFSKVLSPGLRVGYAIGPQPVIQKMVVAKQGEDVHTNIFAQILCDEFIAGCDFEAHLDSLRALYTRKAKLAQQLLETHLTPAGIRFNPIQGGLFIWCTLPDGVGMTEFCTAAVRDHKVAVVPGNAFLVDEALPCNSFRINFSTPTDEQLEIGMERLGRFAATTCTM